MVPGARRLWIAVSLAFVVGTKGFFHHPSFTARVAKMESSASTTSSAVRRASLSRLPRRPRVAAALWDTVRSSRESTSKMCSAQQSVEGGGVMLPPADRADEIADFLSEAICEHLDAEWLPQECHKEIGEEVARVYREALTQGDTDLTTLVLDVGSGLEQFDMGDAFVGPWDIANLVSDFVMEKMGAETSDCSTRAPTEEGRSSAGVATAATAAADAVAPAPAASSFRFTAEKVRQMQTELSSDFARYRFLVDFMEGEANGEDANTVMAVYQGYTPEDADGGGSSGAGGVVVAGEGGVRRGWAAAYPGSSPPDLDTAEGLVRALEADFPDDPDMLEGLEVIVETVYGGEAKRLDQGDPENGVPPNPVYLRRATVCKWLYLMGFLADDIKRAPDDPAQLAELISGRARLKAQK